MATIHDLQKSISQMNDEEAMFLIKNIRKVRLIVPERKREVLAKKRDSKIKTAKQTVDLFQRMSQEDRDKLIKILEDSE